MYQYFKVLANLTTVCPPAQAVLRARRADWEWALAWLEDNLTSPQLRSAASNDTGSSRFLMRTVSARHTLDRVRTFLLQESAGDGGVVPESSPSDIVASAPPAYSPEVPALHQSEGELEHRSPVSPNDGLPSLDDAEDLDNALL